ncbi:MAG: hypothetical protein LBO78_01200 [Rickettsiales bacterium]|jgi:hypothetical protein|nr:hypothetical protein [Rickettsiales bacterium]
MKNYIRKNSQPDGSQRKHRESSFSIGQLLTFAFLFVLMIWIIGFLSLEVDNQKKAILRMSEEMDSIRNSGEDKLNLYLEKIRDLQKIDMRELVQAELRGVKSDVARIEGEMFSKDDLAKLNLKIAAIEEYNRTYRGTNMVMLVSAGLLREAVERGGGFAPELDAIMAAAGNDRQVAEAARILRPYAAAGVASNARLVSDFEKIAANVVFASNNPLGENPSPRAKLWHRIKGLVKIRRIDMMGDSVTPDMIVAKTGELLRLGDVKAATGELAKLKEIAPEGFEAAKAWHDAASAKAAVAGAMSEINLIAIERAMNDISKQGAGVPSAPRPASAAKQGE